MIVNLIRQPLTAGIVACLATSLSLVAQTVSTSSPYEPEVVSILMEAKVDLANLKTPATLPASLVSLVTAGIVELRSRVDNYDPVARTARTTLYLVAPSQVTPLPAANLPGLTDATLVSQSTLRVESIMHVKGAQLSVAMIGRFVASGGALSLAPGTPFVLTFAYPADALTGSGLANAQFGELSFVIPGSLNLYSAAPVGSITVISPAAN